MAEIIDFAQERSIRRPDEPSFEVQQTLNFCSDEAGGGSIVDIREHGQDYRTFYLRDLGKRMLTSFMELGGRLSKPVMNEFKGLGPEDQDEVQATIDNFRESKRR